MHRELSTDTSEQCNLVQVQNIWAWLWYSSKQESRGVTINTTILVLWVTASWLTGQILRHSMNFISRLDFLFLSFIVADNRYEKNSPYAIGIKILHLHIFCCTLLSFCFVFRLYKVTPSKVQTVSSVCLSDYLFVYLTLSVPTCLCVIYLPFCQSVSCPK